MAARKRRRHIAREEAAPVERTRTATAPSPGGEVPYQGAPQRWNWRTFPVFLAFCSGLLIASVVNGQPDTIAGGVIQIAALLGVGYGIAHIIVTNIVVAGRMRRVQRDRARDAAASDDDAWEDEIVYPDEQPAR